MGDNLSAKFTVADLYPHPIPYFHLANSANQNSIILSVYQGEASGQYCRRTYHTQGLSQTFDGCPSQCQAMAYCY
jgi:hypothetical protein